MVESCFLCDPDPKLVIQSGKHAFAMVGLGPITSTYCVVGAHRHVRSLADLWLEERGAITEIEAIREGLRHDGVDLLMTEHGRVPVCRNDGDQHDQHCFHGHALLFATATNISHEASSFYRASSCFNDLASALSFAASQEHYLLVSPSADQHVVLSGPLNAPRQLSRTLVAIAEGADRFADWRADPRYNEAYLMAERLRSRGGRE